MACRVVEDAAPATASTARGRQQAPIRAVILQTYGHPAGTGKLRAVKILLVSQMYPGPDAPDLGTHASGGLRRGHSKLRRLDELSA